MDSLTHAPSELQDGPILNISTYKFVRLAASEPRRQELLQLCRAQGLKGTILLSPEGINLFIAGPTEGVERLLSHLRSDSRLADLEPKRSYSQTQPFRRMLVRLKKEIIAFGVPEVQPARQTAPKLSARELQSWLDQGRPLRLLDVRNDYEVALGTFETAEHLNIDHFRDFPAAIANLPEESKREPWVMFCTGGIRCEKAGPLMQQAGFEQVYQLDGGILKYFEECGGKHYQGSLFVFDGRVALHPNLAPTGNVLCFACQAVLTREEVSSDHYVEGQSCPHCYDRIADQREQQRLERQERIRGIAETQPGCQAYDNLRRIYVPRRFAGWTLIDFLDAWHPPTGRESWLRWLQQGQIRRGGIVATAEMIVKEGECFVQSQSGTIEPPINPAIELVYEDDWLVVVNKPAPLPVHPCGRFNRNTLSSLMAEAYPRQKLRTAHRLDANTSGLVILCRTFQAARYVQPLFQQGQVEKRYIARVHGHPAWRTHLCQLPLSSAAGEGGGRRVDERNGLPSATNFQVRHLFPDGTSLVEAQPLSGRTHQIRLHLQSLGHAVVGDPLYRYPDGRGLSHTLSVDDPPMCLHAAQIAFRHPQDEQMVTFTCPSPAWSRLPTAEDV